MKKALVIGLVLAGAVRGEVFDTACCMGGLCSYRNPCIDDGPAINCGGTCYPTVGWCLSICDPPDVAEEMLVWITEPRRFQCAVCR